MDYFQMDYLMMSASRKYSNPDRAPRRYGPPAPGPRTGLAAVVLVAILASAVCAIPMTASAQSWHNGRPDAAEAAKIMSGGDTAFRTGKIGSATATYRTLGVFFPGWWIPRAKYMVGRRQSGMPIDEVLDGLRRLIDLQATGPYLPMLMTMASAERLNESDVRLISELSAAEMARPRDDPGIRARNRNGDLETRYSFARARALEAAGLFDQAVAEYNRIIETRPTAMAPRVRLSALLRRLGRSDDAAAVMTGTEGSSLLPSRIRILGGRSGRH